MKNKPSLVCARCHQPKEKHSPHFFFCPLLNAYSGRHQFKLKRPEHSGNLKAAF